MARFLLDPGHGGFDSGAILAARKESNDVLNLSINVAALLKFNNQMVDFTRTTDVTVSLEDRTDKEIRGSYDYFISFHRNAFNGTAQGVETYAYPTDEVGKQLAQKIQTRLEKFFKGRGVKTESFFVLKNTRCPAVLIETGFIDNVEDNKIYDSNLKEIVEAIAGGILAQVGVDMKLPSNPTETEDVYYRVIAGSYKDRSNAESQKKALEEHGFSCFIDIYKK